MISQQMQPYNPGLFADSPFSVYAGTADDMGGMGGYTPMHQLPPVSPTMYGARSPNNMQANLAALFAQQGAAPNFMQQFGQMQPQTGGVPNFMNPAMIGGGFRPPMMPQGGGYDSSGINPHGMYNQGGPLTPPMGQPQMPGRQFPANPGGFAPLRNLGFGGR